MNFSQLEESLERNHRTLCHIIQACGLWQHLGTVGAALRIFPSLRHRVCIPGTPQHANVAAEISNFGANAVVLLQNLMCFGLDDQQLTLLGRACELLVADVAALYASFMATGSPGAAGPSSGSPMVGIPNGPRVYTQPAQQAVSHTPAHNNQWQVPGPSRLSAHAEPPMQAPIAAPAHEDAVLPAELMTPEELELLLSDPWVLNLLAMSSTSAPGAPPSGAIGSSQPSTSFVAAAPATFTASPGFPQAVASAGLAHLPGPSSGHSALPLGAGRYRLIPPPPAPAGPRGPRYPLHLQRGQPGGPMPEVSAEHPIVIGGPGPETSRPRTAPQPRVPEAEPHIADPAVPAPRTPPRPTSSTSYATLSRFRVPSAAVGVGESPRYRPLPAGYCSPKREGKDKGRDKGKGKERA